ELAPADQRGIYFSLESECWAVGFLIGPAMGGWALDHPVYWGANLWLVLVAVFVGWTLYSTTFIYQKKQIGGGVVRLIAGVSLFDAMALATTGWVGGVVITIACFGLTLFFLRYIAGT
ncbi:MAG: hypothetical protein AAFV33_06580, partial [Chloroflexota bacterium]